MITASPKPCLHAPLPGLLLAIVLLLPAIPARASESVPIRLDLTAGTHFPVDVGMRATLELPLRLQVSGSVGVLPPTYLASINKVMVAFEVYCEMTARLIAAALEHSLVFRTQVGWRPMLERGLYFQGGWVFVALGGGLTGSEAIAAATGRTPPLSQPRVEVHAEAILHAVSAEIGWQWDLPLGILVRAMVGGQVTVTSVTRLSSPQLRPAAQEAFRPLFEGGEQYLDDTFQTYVHSPFLGVHLGYRFY